VEQPAPLLSLGPEIWCEGVLKVVIVSVMGEEVARELWLVLEHVLRKEVVSSQVLRVPSVASPCHGLRGELQGTCHAKVDVLHLQTLHLVGPLNQAATQDSVADTSSESAHTFASIFEVPQDPSALPLLHISPIQT